MTIWKITLAAALALALIVAPAAYAGEDERIDLKYGYAAFKHDGDVLVAGDIWKDGYGVRAYLSWGRKGHAQVTDRFSSGPVGEAHNHLGRKLPENTVVRLTVCYTKGGKIHSCSKPHKGRA